MTCKQGWKITSLLCSGLRVEKILQYFSRREGTIRGLEHPGGEIHRSWSGTV